MELLDYCMSYRVGELLKSESFIFIIVNSQDTRKFKLYFSPTHSECCNIKGNHNRRALKTVTYSKIIKKKMIIFGGSLITK